MTRTPYRIAVLGSGIGAEHVAGLAALPRHFRVGWICDLDGDRAAALAATCGARATTQIDAALSDPEVDIVDICLPPHLHVPMTLQALAAGKHVVCEKPLAGSVEDADKIVQAATAAQRSVFPVFQYRYGIATRILAALQRRSFLGPLRVATLETHWNRGPDYYSVPWRGTKSHELGGVVLSHAIHIHDLLTVIGGPVSEVSATLSTSINPIETEDCAAIWMRTADGALVTSSITLGAASDRSRLKFVFENATVESGTSPYHPTDQEWRIEPRNPADAPLLKTIAESAMLKPGPHYDGFSGFFAHVASALDRGFSDQALASGRNSIELANAIYLSAELGRAVSLPLSRQEPGAPPSKSTPRELV